MSMERDITFNLEVNVEQALSQIRQYEMILFRCLGLAQRFGLPENIQAQIREFQQLVMTIRLAHTALVALQVLELSMGNPLAWARMIVTGISAAMSMGELVMETQ